MKNLIVLLTVACLLPGAAKSQVAAGGTFVNFESAQTNPVRLSPDGTRLVTASLVGLNTYACQLCGNLRQLESLARRRGGNFTAAERAQYLRR